MDEWMDGWMDGWMDRWMDGWILILIQLVKIMLKVKQNSDPHV
jgi:hypothetical protein